jgi:hypothetical protein
MPSIFGSNNRLFAQTRNHSADKYVAQVPSSAKSATLHCLSAEFPDRHLMRVAPTSSIRPNAILRLGHFFAD